MTVRKRIMSLTAIAVAGIVLVIGTLTDVRARIRQAYPSAEVAIHEGHSPGVHPVLSLLRLVRGQHFVPYSEGISVQIEDEVNPVDLNMLFRFRLNSIHLTRCKVDDLTPLINRKPSVFAEFISCDLTDVPQMQKAELRISQENRKKLVYGGP